MVITAATDGIVSEIIMRSTKCYIDSQCYCIHGYIVTSASLLAVQNLLQQAIV